MSLLTDLQADVIDSGRSLTTALRRAKVLSFNLKNAQLRSWVERELSGYQDKDSVPDYRRLKVQSRGNFMNTAWRYQNQAIPLSALPKNLQPSAAEHIVFESIPSLETTLQSGDGPYQVPWPPELAYFLSYRVFDNLACVSAWKEIQRSQLVDVIEAVRNRLLTMALELMSQIPDLKNDKWEKAPGERVQTIVNSNIYGGQNTVAVGEQVTQNVSVPVQEGDIESPDSRLAPPGCRC